MCVWHNCTGTETLRCINKESGLEEGEELLAVDLLIEFEEKGRPQGLQDLSRIRYVSNQLHE